MRVISRHACSCCGVPELSKHSYIQTSPYLASLRGDGYVCHMQDPQGVAQQQVVRPLCVALLDTTGTEEYLELVRCSLLAALEALLPCTAFGLATFSDKVTGMWRCLVFIAVPPLSSPGQATAEHPHKVVYSEARSACLQVACLHARMRCLPDLQHADVEFGGGYPTICSIDCRLSFIALGPMGR